jgi:AcrR family transcriptional regulator
MPVKPGDPIDPAATRAKVLASAGELFYARGVHAVGVDEIARSAGVSKLSIYRHFGSKEHLVAEVVAARSDRVHRRLAAAIRASKVGVVGLAGQADHADTPRGRILAVFDALCAWYGEPDFRGCAIVNAAADTRGDHGDVPGIARGHLRRYQTLFENELAALGVTDPTPAARQLLVLVEGATVVAALEGHPEAGAQARRLAEMIVDSLDPDR